MRTYYLMFMRNYYEELIMMNYCENLLSDVYDELLSIIIDYLVVSIIYEGYCIYVFRLDQLELNNNWLLNRLLHHYKYHGQLNDKARNVTRTSTISQERSKISTANFTCIILIPVRTLRQSANFKKKTGEIWTIASFALNIIYTA